MANKGALTVIVCCFLIHALAALDMPSYFVNSQYPFSKIIAINIGFRVSLLLFPVFGLLADMYFTRYRMIQVSFVSLIVFLISGLIIGNLFDGNVFPWILKEQLSARTLLTVGSIMSAFIILLSTASVGLFEANAIQFGMDQLLEASSRQLSKFIHWYFWSMLLGQEVVFCIVLGIVGVLALVSYQSVSESEVNSLANVTLTVRSATEASRNFRAVIAYG